MQCILGQRFVLYELRRISRNGNQPEDIYRLVVGGEQKEIKRSKGGTIPRGRVVVAII